MRELKRKTEENPRTRRANNTPLFADAIITIFIPLSVKNNVSIADTLKSPIIKTKPLFSNVEKARKYRVKTSWLYSLDNRTHVGYRYCHPIGG